MTRKQYERWKLFSLAMAQHGFKQMTERRRARLTEEVGSWLDNLNFGEEWKAIESWDQGENSYYLCDTISEEFDRFQHEKLYKNGSVSDVYGKFYGQICCCLRAGLDMTARPANGVLGFDVGDLRRMFGGKIPLWLSRQYKGGLARAKDDETIWL